MSTEAFKVTMHLSKKDGRGSVDRKEPISRGDREKLNIYMQNCSSPIRLQQKVFLDVMFHFCRRGHENLRAISKDSFVFQKNENNVEYVTMKDELDKNHRGNDITSQQARMYATGTPDCPVQSLKLCISKLNASTPCFFQRPKMVAGDACWYDAAPLGKNSIGLMMQKISKDAGLSRRYTNH